MAVKSIVALFTLLNICSAFEQQCSEVKAFYTEKNLGYYQYLEPSQSYHGLSHIEENIGCKKLGVTFNKTHFYTYESGDNFRSRFPNSVVHDGSDRSLSFENVDWHLNFSHRRIPSEIMNRDIGYLNGMTATYSFVSGECFQFAAEHSISKLFGCYDMHKAFKRGMPEGTRKAYMHRHGKAPVNPYPEGQCRCELIDTYALTRPHGFMVKCGDKLPNPPLPFEYQFATSISNVEKKSAPQVEGIKDTPPVSESMRLSMSMLSFIIAFCMCLI